MTATPERRRADVVPLREATRAWAAISLQTFGGPAGQIAVMQRELVEERGWIGQRRFLHALSFCTLLPGPEAQQLAVYTGWLLNGVRGGLIAGTLFVLPGLAAILALSALYVSSGDTLVVSGLLAGLAPAVVAVVAQALVRIGRRSLDGAAPLALAGAAFAALTLTRTPYPVVIALAALAGWALARRTPPSAPEPAASAPLADDGALVADDDDALASPGRGHAARVLAVGLVAWAVPMAAAVLLAGRSGVLAEQGLFFSGTALISFGGAYAALALVAQRAVEVYGWLAPGEMVRGLGLAESTPGPLIMVVTFVAFVGAYRDPGSLDPWLAALLGALLTTWVTFVPSFVLVFLGAPVVERLRAHRGLAAALTGVSAAVVGVIAHLALFFASHTLVGEVRTIGSGWLVVDLPDLTTVRPWSVAFALLAAGLLLGRGWSVLRVLGGCAALGAALALLGTGPA